MNSTRTPKEIFDEFKEQVNSAKRELLNLLFDAQNEVDKKEYKTALDKMKKEFL